MLLFIAEIARSSWIFDVKWTFEVYIGTMWRACRGAGRSAEEKGAKMAKRIDGIKTRDRILSTACEVFAEMGYHDATIEEICRRAECNIAAINYHFGSKDHLYARVWRRAFDEAIKAYPPEGGLGPEHPPEDRLRGTIYAVVGKAVDTGRIGHAGKLLLREMTNPTDVIEDVKRDAIAPLHRRMNNLMRELLGPDATDQQLLLCQMSVLHQCIAIGMRLFTDRKSPHMQLRMTGDRLLEALTEHIWQFSLAGIRAVREEIEADRLSLESRSRRN